MEEQINEDSTIDHPLRFFEHFFNESGYQEFRYEFFASGDDVENSFPIRPIDLNKSAKLGISGKLNNSDDEFILNYIKTGWLSSPQGDWMEEDAIQKIYFKDQLKLRLNNELDLSKKFIFEKITSFDFKQGKIVTFLKSVLGDLGHIISTVKSSDFFLRYPVNLEILYQFIDFLFKRFNTFLSPIEYPIFNETEEFLSNIEEEIKLLKEEKTIPDHTNESKKKTNDIQALKWKTNQLGNTLLLFDLLSHNNIIQVEQDTLENLKLAFGGRFLDKPLKIKWILTKNNSIKPTLIRIIKRILMIELKVIENMENGELAKTLTQIFIDKHGNSIKNMIVTLSTDVSNNCTLGEIDLITKLRSLPFQHDINS